MKMISFVVALFAAFSIHPSGSMGGNNIDLNKSILDWKGTKVTGEHFGKIKIKSVSLKMDAGKIKSGEIVVDMDSITVEDISGSIANKFVGHMKSGDFFEVSKFPTSKLVINGDNGSELMGSLTIKGKTNKVKVPYNKSGNTYTGTLKFDRTKYDMRYGSGSFFKNLGDKMIHNDVTLKFKITLK
jgi:polyisoprenoid-binding protein YceI